MKHDDYVFTISWSTWQLVKDWLMVIAATVIIGGVGIAVGYGLRGSGTPGCDWDEEVYQHYADGSGTCIHRDFVDNEHMPQHLRLYDERVK